MPLEITQREFEKISKLVYESFGIVLNESKKSLVINRLNKLFNKLQIHSFPDYYQNLINDKSGRELQLLANSISTNHTFFYREHKHFEFYTKQALPDVVSRIDDNDLRVWCAASSTGEEPYTLAMLQKEFFGVRNDAWNSGLLASDISEKALRQAQLGIYKEEAVKALPAALRNKYFKKSGFDNLEVKASLKQDVHYGKLNLIHDFQFKKPFHIIFCRNVMIYFDQPTKDKLIEKFFRWMVPGGYLFIGHAETIPRKNCPFNYLMPAVYQKPLNGRSLQ